MAVELETVRAIVLGWPDTTEEPHHHFGSFRVRGKIFVTLPPGGEWLHIFLPDHERELALSLDPEFLEPLPWGSKILGVRAQLPLARESTLLRLIEQAYAYAAAKVPAKRARVLKD